MFLEELVFTPEEDALQALRTAWQWRLGASWQPVLFSVIGDVFLELPSGHIWWLSTATGDLEQVAASRAAFLAALESEQANEWLLPGLMAVLQEQGKYLLPGQCYGYITLPVFAEGSFSAENMLPVEASEHFSLTGAMHRALCGLPDGEQVQLVVKL